MQSHLATRLGRWNRSVDSSTKAIELERAYHQFLNVKPREDHQFSHHLEVLFLSLLHDGRYREARALRKECDGHGYKHWIPWFRLAMAERDHDEALKIAEQFRKRDKITASYLAALVYLARNEPTRAAPEVEVLEEAHKGGKKDKQTQYRLWEARGLLLCQTDGADAGLKLIAKAVDMSKDDYSHHAWGNGAYYMEVWGLAAAQVSRLDVAEEAFLEALAHDSGSVRAAMAMQVLCETQGRTDEAKQYGELAHRFWKNAEVQTFDAELAAVRQRFGITTAVKPTISEGISP
jgi:tetratricopeptide (TPR) repeat protein